MAVVPQNENRDCCLYRGGGKLYQNPPEHEGAIAFLITSDEESPLG